MSYRVLARTYRSETFDEVVGQAHVATTLKNAIASGRIHHGYLFTGTRGVGKTSMARILAKALNCLNADAPTPSPCCRCDACRAIAIGEDVDVVEIDAASNTGVDNIRELRSNASLRPARSRFKVYIIDEVHMLSTGAFNALLKTLEEPPSHVKFILATTEAHKVPATIQSRCQRFDFRAIAADAIADHLGRILEKEGIGAEQAVLRRVARLARGSMRDALSLLDQLLSYGADPITLDLVETLVPPPHDELAGEVMDCVAKEDAAGALAALDRALQSGRTVERFCEHLIEHVRTLMLLRLTGKDTDLVDVPAGAREELARQSEAFDAPTYVYMIALLEQLRRTVKFSGAARALADAAVVRLAMSRNFTDLGTLLERLEGGDGAASAAPAGGGKKNAAKRDTPPLTSQSPSPASSSPRPKGTSAEASAGPAAEKPASEVVPASSPGGAAPRPSSAEWEKVTRDPLVMRVKEAVEGTLLDVRPLTPAVASSAGDDPDTAALPPDAEQTDAAPTVE